MFERNPKSRTIPSKSPSIDKNKEHLGITLSIAIHLIITLTIALYFMDFSFSQNNGDATPIKKILLSKHNSLASKQKNGKQDKRSQKEPENHVYWQSQPFYAAKLNTFTISTQIPNNNRKTKQEIKFEKEDIRTKSKAISKAIKSTKSNDQHKGNRTRNDLNTNNTNYHSTGFISSGNATPQKSNRKTISQSLQQQILSAIENHKHFPPEAAVMHWQGKNTISFTLQPSGQLTNISIARSSQYALFDQAALQAVANASPIQSTELDTINSPVELEVDIIFNEMD